MENLHYMEIERKFLICKNNLPENLTEYPYNELEQAYIITEPVLRIRKKDESYILTYKGQGFLAREEAEFPLTQEAYQHLLSKTDGNIISKKRYRIPEKNNLTIELDVFSGVFTGLYLAEVEFPDKITALNYQKPAWFGPEVTNQSTFQNSVLSTLQVDEIEDLISNLKSRF